MLKFMRKHATGFLIKALFGIIIIVFIFWGVGSFREREKVVAEVGSYKIYFREYIETYNKFLNLYRMIYRDRLDENLLKSLKIKEKVMDELIDKYVLLINAKKLGVNVYEKELDEHIANINAFKRDGRFSQKTYEEILKRNNLDPKRFEEMERVSIITSRLVNIVTDNGVFMDDNDLWTAYIKEKGKVDLSYRVFDPADYKKNVTITDKEIEEVYEKEKGSYKNENSYRLKYILIDEKAPVKDDAVYLELLKVKDIDGYAKKNGLTVIDIENIKESELLKRFRSVNIGEWLKGLKKGDISLPVRVDTKSYIFKLIDIEEGKPFDKTTVVKILRERMAAEKSKGYARAVAEDAINKKDFTGAKTTGFIPRNSTSIPKIGSIPQDNLGIFSVSSKNPLYNKPVDISGRYYIFSYRDEKLPDKKDWEKDKESYKRYLTARNSDEFFKSFLTDLRKKEKINIYWQEI